MLSVNQKLNLPISHSIILLMLFIISTIFIVLWSLTISCDNTSSTYYSDIAYNCKPVSFINPSLIQLSNYPIDIFSVSKLNAYTGNSISGSGFSLNTTLSGLNIYFENTTTAVSEVYGILSYTSSGSSINTTSIVKGSVLFSQIAKIMSSTYFFNIFMDNNGFLNSTILEGNIFLYIGPCLPPSQSFCGTLLIDADDPVFTLPETDVNLIISSFDPSIGGSTIGVNYECLSCLSGGLISSNNLLNMLTHLFAILPLIYTVLMSIYERYFFYKLLKPLIKHTTEEEVIA